MSIKIKHKKLLASGIAVVMTGILGVGTLLQSSISVQASPAMMPGIEEIVNNTSSSDKPFRILEIVDEKSEAEIGYYISGQEPYIKLYEYEYTDDCGEIQTITFSSLEDGLSKLPENKRKEFASNVKIGEDGNRWHKHKKYTEHFLSKWNFAGKRRRLSVVLYRISGKVFSF